jgi:hypothetical protein
MSCSLWGTNWGSYFAENGIQTDDIFCSPPNRSVSHYYPLLSLLLHSFIVTAVKTTNLIIVTDVETSNHTYHYPAGLCSGDVIFHVRYELCFYVQEDGVLHSHRRENLKSYMKSLIWQFRVILTRTIFSRERNTVKHTYFEFLGKYYDYCHLHCKAASLCNNIWAEDTVFI